MVLYDTIFLLRLIVTRTLRALMLLDPSEVELEWESVSIMYGCLRAAIKFFAFYFATHFVSFRY